jgi:predicted nucleotidyltransferase
MFTEHLRLYRSLNKHKVDYLVIGGVASVIYGVPRTTIDLDLFIRPTLANCRRLLVALKEVKFGTAYLTDPATILSKEITVLSDFIEVDILIKPKGISFANAWKKRSIIDIQGVKVNFISLSDLIKAKNASNRKIDKEDVKILRHIKGKNL